ncbi:hypothetical protein DFH29DRAFT_999312 [Suillus ampliporus]|nr:hypothetical protein DFH29DRAFT_999312 [Suillus ampliporus]
MAHSGKTHAVKRDHPQLTTIQKAACHEKFVSLTNDINDTRAAYMDKVQGLAKKHGQSERWTQRQLYLGRKTVCHQRAPNAWNRFVCQRLNDINKGLSHGDRWKLTEFIEDHNGTLKHDYSKLTAAQKNAFVIEIMKRRVEKQKIVCDNLKAVQHDMLTSFAAMDQEWMALCSQLGIKGFYIAVQGGVEDLSRPKLFFLEKAEKFMHTILDSEPCHCNLLLTANEDAPTGALPLIGGHANLPFNEELDGMYYMGGMRGGLGLALKLEAFVVLGLDANVSTTKPRSLNKLIGDCQTHIRDELDYILQENKITAHKITMNYANYERSIVEHYGVTLQGGREQVQTLLDALNNKTCTWSTLPEDKLRQRMTSNRARHANGEAVYKPRKKHTTKTTEKSVVVVNSDTDDLSSSSSDLEDK